MVENGSTAVGFTAFTFEYSDLRDGAFFWMQGLQVAADLEEAPVLQALKAALDAHRETLDYKCCGIRVVSPKAIEGVAE